MKTTTTLLLILSLSTISLSGIFQKQNSLPKLHQKTPASKNLVSFPRSFMPYNDDPCNHLEARDSFC